MIFDPQTIPAELRDRPQWVVWRLEYDPDGKTRKMPYNMYSGFRADVTNPDNLGSIYHALECYSASQLWASPYSGVGFALLRGQNLSVIDLDDVQNPPSQFHASILNGFNSFTEVSPSGSGYHIWMIGEVPNKKRTDVGVEIYSCDRFMTMTGVIANPVGLQPRQEYLEKLRSEMGRDVDEGGYIPNVEDTGPEGDAKICDALYAMKNGDKFLALYQGNWEGMYPSQSEADIALINMLAFAHPNRDQVYRIFLKSALGQRDKAKSIYHFNRMFNKACDRMVPPVDMTEYKATIAKAMEQAKAEASNAGSHPSNPAPNNGAATVETQGVAKPASAYSWPDGLVGEIAHYIYSASPRPVYEVAIAASIGLMAGICGRGTNVSRTGLNMYVLLLAQSGRGKEAMKGGIDKIMSAVSELSPAARKFVGPSTIASPQALNRHFEKSSTSFVSILGEFGHRLQQMSSLNGNSAQMGVRQMILDVYNKSGQTDVLGEMIYSDSDKNVGSIKSPAFSILAESNPHTFYEILDERSVNDGLLPRFLLIEYMGPAMYIRKEFAEAKVPDSLKFKMHDLVTEMARRMDQNAVQDVVFDDEAAKYLDAFSTYCTDQINAPNGQSEVVANLWNRAHLKALKLAAILATGCNWHKPVLMLHHAEWAVNMVNRDTVMLLNKFERGEIGDSLHAKQMKEFKRGVQKFLKASVGTLTAYGVTAIMHENKFVPYGYFSRYLSSKGPFKDAPYGTPEAIKRILDYAVKSGHLSELAPADKIRLGLRNTIAFSVDDPDFFLAPADAA